MADPVPNPFYNDIQAILSERATGLLSTDTLYTLEKLADALDLETQNERDPYTRALLTAWDEFLDKLGSFGESL
jgi:hypothetical protein